MRVILNNIVSSLLQNFVSIVYYIISHPQHFYNLSDFLVKDENDTRENKHGDHKMIIMVDLVNSVFKVVRSTRFWLPTR